MRSWSDTCRPGSELHSVSSELTSLPSRGTPFQDAAKAGLKFGDEGTVFAVLPQRSLTGATSKI